MEIRLMTWRSLVVALLTATLMSSAAYAFGPATQPSGAGAGGSLQFKASEAFNRGQYAAALPLFQKLLEQSKDRPDEVGPIQEKIRVCQTAIAKATADQANQTNPASSDPATSAEKRVPHQTPKAGETLELTIKELGNFDYDADHGGNIPADVKNLSCSKLRLRGFMIPMDQADQITQFALVPSLFACCFGQPPQIQHTIIVNCPKGKAVSYFPDEIQVEGTLKVQEKKEDNFIVSIFEMDCQSVKPAAR
jgi:hypothetical protein